jgi:hypothetical protein
MSKERIGLQSLRHSTLEVGHSILEGPPDAGWVRYRFLGFLIEDEVGGKSGGHELAILVGNAGLPD